MKRKKYVSESPRQKQVRGPDLTELMIDSEIKGDEFRKKNSGSDVLSHRIQHQESKQENPKKDIYNEQDNE